MWRSERNNQTFAMNLKSVPPPIIFNKSTPTILEFNPTKKLHNERDSAVDVNVTEWHWSVSVADRERSVDKRFVTHGLVEVRDADLGYELGFVNLRGLGFVHERGLNEVVGDRKLFVGVSDGEPGVPVAGDSEVWVSVGEVGDGEWVDSELGEYRAVDDQDDVPDEVAG